MGDEDEKRPSFAKYHIGEGGWGLSARRKNLKGA